MKTDLKYDDFKQYEVEIPNKESFEEHFKSFGESFSHRFRFENNYGASVIKHFRSYGYEDDLFELAVLYYDEEGKSHLTYNTPITDDVIGWLTNNDVIRYLNKIKNLTEEGR